VRDAQRTLPRAIVVGVLGVVVLYLALNASYLRVLGIGGIAADSQFASIMARRTMGSTGGEILQAAMGVSALGVCVVTILATPWLYVAMAREGLFFASVGRLHPRTGAPVNALALQMVVALAYWFWGRAEVLVDSVVFVEWIFHALVAIALLRLRATRPDLPRPFRSPLYPLAPIGYLLIAIAVVAGNLIQANVRAVVIGLSVLVIGAIIYKPWRALVAART
jgi:APA family basic amino acid/polyamine antiporter